MTFVIRAETHCHAHCAWCLFYCQLCRHKGFINKNYNFNGIDDKTPTVKPTYSASKANGLQLKDAPIQRTLSPTIVMSCLYHVEMIQHAKINHAAIVIFIIIIINLLLSLYPLKLHFCQPKVEQNDLLTLSSYKNFFSLNKLKSPCTKASMAHCTMPITFKYHMMNNRPIL